MKKKLICTVFTVLLLMSFAGNAFADHLTGADNWSVVFTPAEKLESNFASDFYADQVKQLQPGDDITFTVNLRNDNEHTVDWYMSNKVISTLEQSSYAAAEGGGYSYKLTYEGQDTSLVLYDSDTVGGDNSQGMLNATDALDEFLYLDTLAYGDKGVVTLVVALDGETQGNDYQLTLADLKMNFAVELDTTTPTTSNNQPTTAPSSSTTPTTGTSTNTNSNAPRDVVRTGDDNKLIVYYSIMAGSGILFLILAIDSVRRRRKEKKESAK